MIKKKHIAFLAFLLFSFGNHLFAQENPDAIALVDDQLENNFYEAVKQRGIENYDKAIVAIQKCIEKEFSIEVDVYYESRRADLDNCFKILFDSLQKNCLIDNDRYCQRIVANRHIDKLNPRVEFLLTEIC